MLDSADADSPSTNRWLSLLATVVAVAIVGAVIYGYLYGSESECVRESDRAYIARLESQGYICEVKLFSDDRRRTKPVEPGKVNVSFGRTDRKVCCTLPEPEEQ